MKSEKERKKQGRRGSERVRERQKETEID